ncbi:MAG TPA: ferredoxin, partial [Bacillota bacterium]|nr:ferredoxin [Bacillota bacterium]
MNCPTGAISVRAGVGCAYAVIRGLLTGGPPSCDCGGGDGDSCC